MILSDAIARIFANLPNKYRRERWRHARGQLEIKAMIRICEAEGYTVTITVK